MRHSSEPVILVLSQEDASTLLSSFASAVRGRDDYDYLVAQEAGDYEPDDIVATKAVHVQERDLEARVYLNILSQTAPVGYFLESPQHHHRYGEFTSPEGAEAALADHRAKDGDHFDESWKVVPSYVPNALPRVYLDLSTEMLPEEEMQNILMAPPVVRDHPYGAFVHVAPAEADWSQDPLNAEYEAEWAQFPHLLAVLLAAREMKANWVNFDGDGHDVLTGLPTFTW